MILNFYELIWSKGLHEKQN